MDAFLGFLNNPVILTIVTVLWGLLVKYHSAFKKVPNALIPYFNAAITLLVKLGAASAASAATAAPVVSQPVMALLGASFWQAVISSLVYEVFIRTGLSKALSKPAP
jgi:hypothetical protein